MAKHTNRYDNENLINLAKQDYESKKQSTIPSEIVSLVSEGKVYPKNHPLRPGKIEMRYMTAYDEDILTNASYIKEGVVLERLIQALIVSDIDYNEIAQVDKDGLILSARILSYGAEYPVRVVDPKTKKYVDRVVDLSKLQTKTIDLKPDDRGEFIYESEKHLLKFKFPTTTELGDNNTISSFLQNTITEIDGKRKKSDIEHFIQYEFLALDSKQFQKYLIENTPTMLLEYEFEGENGSTFSSGFPIGPDFFWP